MKISYQICWIKKRYQHIYYKFIIYILMQILGSIFHKTITKLIKRSIFFVSQVFQKLFIMIGLTGLSIQNQQKTLITDKLNFQEVKLLVDQVQSMVICMLEVNQKIMTVGHKKVVLAGVGRMCYHIS